MAQLWPKISWAVAAPPPQHLTSNRKPRTSGICGKNFGPNARSTREKSAKNWKNLRKKIQFFSNRPTLAQCWLMIIRKPIDAFNGSNRSLGPQVGLAMCQNLPLFDLQGQIFLKPNFRFLAKKLGQLWRQKSAKRCKNPQIVVKRQIIGSAMGFPPIGGWGLSANCGTRYAPKTAPGWKKGEILKIFNCGFFPFPVGGLQLLL